jgi:hypothetical protein
MPSTYEPIATTTTGSATASVTFSSLGTYTDIILVANGGTVSSGGSFYVRFNSDTGSNYSFTSLVGQGTAASSNRAANGTSGFISGNLVGIGSGTTTIANFMNYGNTTTYKTVLTRSSNAAGDVEANVTLWRNTAAITSIQVIGTNANIDANVSFTLYGIKNA